MRQSRVEFLSLEQSRPTALPETFSFGPRLFSLFFFLLKLSPSRRPPACSVFSRFADTRERERDSLAPVHLASVGQRLARKSKKKANKTKELSRLSTCDR